MKVKSRVKNDSYPTECGIIDKLAIIMPELFEQESYFEPCAGKGELVKAIARYTKPYAPISTADNYPLPAHGYTYPYFDATDPNYWARTNRSWDVVITNPPFSDAPAIATQCWQRTNRYLVLILRLSFLEQCANRREFWKTTQDYLVMIAPINPRPRFRSDTTGSDNVTCAVYVWDKLHSWKSLGLRSPYQMISDWRK